jgi:hypothetical protein
VRERVGDVVRNAVSQSMQEGAQQQFANIH